MTALQVARNVHERFLPGLRFFANSRYPDITAQRLDSLTTCDEGVEMNAKWQLLSVGLLAGPAASQVLAPAFAATRIGTMKVCHRTVRPQTHLRGVDEFRPKEKRRSAAPGFVSSPFAGGSFKSRPRRCSDEMLNQDRALVAVAAVWCALSPSRLLEVA
jgi:hypothetical protein